MCSKVHCSILITMLREWHETGKCYIILCAQIDVNIKDISRELGLSQSHWPELLFFCPFANTQVT